MSRLAWREVSNTPRQSRGMATSVARPFEAEVAALNLANGLAVQPVGKRVWYAKSSLAELS